MNNFLRTRSEIDTATKYLQDNDLIESGISCKNWEIVQVLPYLKDGFLLDMGSDGSVVINNAIRKGTKGVKAGIDLAYLEDTIYDDKSLIKGDLTDVPFPDYYFDTITCLSVIEHQVDFSKLAKECSRLLKKDGNLLISFDYWNPKPEYEKRKLYSLDWNILDENDVKRLVIVLAENGLVLNGKIDWTLQDAVINDQYCSPAKDVSYTFGILHFIKL